MKMKATKKTTNQVCYKEDKHVDISLGFHNGTAFKNQPIGGKVLANNDSLAMC